jgi:hypothetical protein
MRSLLIVFALSPAIAVAEPPFEPLTFLADHCWKGIFPGGKVSDEHCFSWMYGGKFLRDRHTLHAEGRADGLGESMYFWDPAAHKLRYLYLESGGGYAEGEVAPEADALVFPETALVGAAGRQVYRSRWQRSGTQAYDVLTEFRTPEGWVTGFKVHMELAAGHTSP